jgi:hypothetical protein
LKDVALIDKDKEWKYTASLMAFLAQNHKHRVIANLPKEDEKKEKKKRQITSAATTTTNTAKSIPAVNKSKKG